MRDTLAAYAALHEIQTELPARAVSFPPLSHFLFGNARFGMGVLAFVLILLLGSGSVAYAAEGSLPGSPLYPVKVSIIEPVQGALIPSAAGRASWHADLASRRLEEATTLAAANQLDPATQNYLQEKFNTEVDTSNTDADALAASGDRNAALDVRSDLEARITAHAEILAVIRNHFEATASSTLATTSTTLTGTDALLAAVQQRRQEVIQARLVLEGKSDSAFGTSTMPNGAEVPPGTTRSEVGSTKQQNTTPGAVSRIKPAAPHAARAAVHQPEQGMQPSLDTAHAAKRSSEIASILLQHARLLRAFAPVATTSTSTPHTSKTATTTRATTTESAHTSGD